MDSWKTLDQDPAVRALDPRGERSGSQLKERIIHLFGKYLFTELLLTEGFPGGSDSKESACNAGDLSSIPGSGRYLGEGNDNFPLVFLPGKSLVEPGGLQSMGSQRARHN